MKRTHSSADTLYNDFITKCLPILVFSALTGIASGVIVVLYSYVAEFLTHNSLYLYELVAQNVAFIPLLLIALVILAFISFIILKFIPDTQSTCAPRTHYSVRRFTPITWWRSLIGTVFSSFIAFFAGLSLGSEGSSTAVGSAIGNGMAKLHKSKRLTEAEKDKSQLIIASSGASAGSSAAVTAAFNAPVTGFLFAMEDLHHKLSPLLLLSAGTATATSVLISSGLRYALNLEQSILLPPINPIPIEYIWTLIVLGIVCGILSVLFNKVFLKICESSFIKRIPLPARLIAIFFITGIAGLFLAESISGGASLLNSLTNADFTWWLLLVVFIIKVLLTTLAFGSGSSGGLLIPTLTIGALIGALFGKFFTAVGLSEEYYITLILIAMSAFFAATFRTPITAIVLLVETTGSFSGILTVGVEVLIAFIVAELIIRKPITKHLLRSKRKE